MGEMIPGPGENAAAYALEALVKTAVPEARNLSSTLLFRTNMSQVSVHKMKVLRRQIYEVAVWLEAQGTSSETTLAIRGLEDALHHGIKHLCLTDPEAKIEEL